MDWKPAASIPARFGERSVNTPLLSGLIYLLGFVGLVSIGVLPLRSLRVLRNVFRRGASHTSRKVLAAFVVLVAAAALWGDVQIMMRIFKCLTRTYCGPGIASGWTYLACSALCTWLLRPSCSFCEGPVSSRRSNLLCKSHDALSKPHQMRGFF